MEETVEEEPKFLLELGGLAPDFEAVTTHGTIKLSDFRGKWVILFSHPADFTPVCTTEFVAFSKIWPELQKRNTQLIGLSIDSVFSHIAWVRNIEEKQGVKVPFPVIADLDMKVAKLYGMVHEATSATQAVRAVFFIDPEGYLRAMIYYPQTAGRNMDEILRLLDSLQLTDAKKVVTGANWRPGEMVIVPPPRTQADAEKRLKEGYECVDWYLCKKKV
jgi:peroxiredoxin (alkyl hydroperoxide reductase subunit C)